MSAAFHVSRPSSSATTRSRSAAIPLARESVLTRCILSTVEAMVGRPRCGCSGGDRPAGWCSDELALLGADFYAARARAAVGAGGQGLGAFRASSRRSGLHLDVRGFISTFLRVGTSS